MENVTLLNKTHKANKNLFFYCKNLDTLWGIIWRKQVMKKEKNKTKCENQEQMFVAALGVNDHRTCN